MKKLLITLLAVSGIAHAATTESANTYTLDKTHSFVEFRYNHMGFSNPSGKFVANGTVYYESNNLAKSKADINIDLSSLTTGVAGLDRHLQSADFFDTSKYPTAKFVSTKITPIDKNHFSMLGNLTVHGVTKPVTLQVLQNGQGISPVSQRYTLGYSATGVIKRSDFGIAAYVPAVSDDIMLTIEIEARQ